MKRTQLRWVPWMAALLIRFFRVTVRARHLHLDRIESLNRAGRNYIIAFWHGHLLLMVYARFGRPMHAMISRHRDGELIARTLTRFGITPVRGSTSRGGSAALRDLVRASARGYNLAITPDGPRGPRRIAQGGVITAARLAGIPIVPIALVTKKKSFCAPGIVSKCHFRSPARSTSMANRCRFRGRPAPRNWSVCAANSNAI